MKSTKKKRRPIRILLAEDDDSVRDALERLLSFDGFDVVAVRDGAQLLDALASWIVSESRQDPADLIVTDVRMPGFSGLNIVEGLRDAGWRKPIIVISAFGDAHMARRIEELGGVTFIPKPFEPEYLERVIDRLLLN